MFGYRQTYEEAAHVLAGSTHTLGMLKEYFSLKDSNLELFHENAIKSSFLWAAKEKNRQRTSFVNLLFVGRLVPYKGADMLLEALTDNKLKTLCHLTIVGDGVERKKLEALVDTVEKTKINDPGKRLTLVPVH